MKLRLALLLILIAAILAFKFLPWYVLVGLAVVFVLSIKFLGKKALLWVFSLPFRAKGAALRGAPVEVHSIEPCPAPQRRSGDSDDDDEDSENGEASDDDGAHDEGEEFESGVLITGDVSSNDPRSYYRVEATISPKHSKQLFDHWEIGELGLGLPNYSPMDGDGKDACPIDALEVELDGKFTPDDGYKLMGPQRLRFVVDVSPGVQRLVFNYYFETFGEVQIPAPK